MRKKLVAGNWKMNGNLAANARLLEGLRSAKTVSDVVVCAPYPYLFQLQQVLEGSSVQWGAQNVCQFDSGAYTGEVGGAMLREFGCRYAIVGHSERRAIYGESDALVAKRAAAALHAGLVPIICLGETLEEREAGRTGEVVSRQFDAVANEIKAEGLAASVLAYEPVWAIGTGRTASAAQAQEVHALIRRRLADVSQGLAGGVHVLYGGSVKGSNAAELFSMPDVDGGLIGGASLQIDDFLAICNATGKG